MVTNGQLHQNYEKSNLFGTVLSLSIRFLHNIFYLNDRKMNLYTKITRDTSFNKVSNPKYHTHSSKGQSVVSLQQIDYILLR